MPRAPKPAPIAPSPKIEYFILDSTATAIAGRKLQVDQKTIDLTEAEAAFYLASGTISTQKPAADDVVAAAFKTREDARVAEEKARQDAAKAAEARPPADDGPAGKSKAKGGAAAGATA